MTINSTVNKIARWTAVAMLASAGLHPAPVAAQGSMTCTQAKNTLTANNPKRADLFRAASHIFACLNDAPGAIATGLRRAPAGSVRDTVLNQAAYLLFDRDLVDSVRVLALDQSQALAKRLGYLQLLTRYVSPGTGIDLTAATSGKLMALAGAGGGQGGVPGVKPMDIATRDRAIDTMYSMKLNESDAGLRALANMVYHELYYRFH